VTASDYSIRAARSDDLPAIQTALAWAIAWRSAELGAAPNQLIERTGHAYLLADWGREGDVAVVADTTAGPVGAAWYRFWTDSTHSYGYVASDVPELGIGLDPGARGRGIGASLLRTLLKRAVTAGVARISLSVEGDNAAMRLYEAFGFTCAERIDDSWTMVKELSGSGSLLPVQQRHRADGVR